MPAPKLFVDFGNADAQGRLRLNCRGTLRDLDRQHVALQEGMRLSLYSDDATEEGESSDLVIDGRATFSTEEDCWVAVIDWAEIRNISDKQQQPETSEESVPQKPASRMSA